MRKKTVHKTSCIVVVCVTKGGSKNTMNTLKNIFGQPAGRSGIMLGLIGGVVAAVLVTCTKIWQDLPPIKQETLPHIALPIQQKSQ